MVVVLAYFGFDLQFTRGLFVTLSLCLFSVLLICYYWLVWVG